MSAYRSDDCPMIFPRAKGQLIWNNEKTIKMFAQYEGVVQKIDMDVHDWLDDDKLNKLGLLVTFTSHFTPSLEIDPYVGKYYVIFHFNDAQDKFTKFIEFCDFSHTPEMLKKVNEGKAKLGLPSVTIPQ